MHGSGGSAAFTRQAHNLAHSFRVNAAVRVTPNGLAKLVVTRAFFIFHQGKVKAFERLFLRRNFKYRKASLDQQLDNPIGSDARVQRYEFPIAPIVNQVSPLQDLQGLSKIASLETDPLVALASRGQVAFKHHAAVAEDSDA